ncbi:MAG: peptide ABC transporter substrate-binding protein, partial [Acidithiobacillales bacterium SM1_46]
MTESSEGVSIAIACRLPVLRWVVAALAVSSACAAVAAWNNPYPPEEAGRTTLYSSFRERPKHLDPARAYSSNEYEFLAQIYEPPFQYHYLRRPYELVPLTAVAVPKPTYLDRKRRKLHADAPTERIAYSVYEVRIRPGIRYQPHPAFARDAAGNHLYQTLSSEEIARRHTIAEFPVVGTRELVAADYVYQIKRLAHPKVHSPILSVMSDYIVGLKEYTQVLKRAQAEAQSRG